MYQSSYISSCNAYRSDRSIVLVTMTSPGPSGLDADIATFHVEISSTFWFPSSQVLWYVSRMLRISLCVIIPEIAVVNPGVIFCSNSCKKCKVRTIGKSYMSFFWTYLMVWGGDNVRQVCHRYSGVARVNKVNVGYQHPGRRTPESKTQNPE